MDKILAVWDTVAKREGEPYEDFITRSASNSLSRRVKRANLEDTTDLRRLPRLTPEDKARLEKYRAAWTRLDGQPGEAD